MLFEMEYDARDIQASSECGQHSGDLPQVEPLDLRVFSLGYAEGEVLFPPGTKVEVTRAQRDTVHRGTWRIGVKVRCIYRSFQSAD